uniref:Protein RecA n=1 Tax=candidate division CPR3 bacterium TaxID=2268181 RepID=A0A7V3J9N2_UNCC3
MEDEIRNIVNNLKKKAKLDQVFVGDDSVGVSKWLSTGIWSVDWVVGGKGFPYGRVAEVYGDFSSGKTWLGFVLLGRAIEKGDIGVLIETEGAFDPLFGKMLGVDMKKLIVVSPDTVEQVYQVLDGIFEEGGGKSVVAVWDSLAATPTEHEIEAGLDVRDMTKALRMSQILRLITKRVEEKNNLLVVLNQVRDVVGQTWGNTEVTPGGRAMSFHATVRIKMSRVGKITDSTTKEVIGQKFRVECTKSKVCVPFRYVNIDFIPGKPVPCWEGIVDILKRKGYVVEKGGWNALVGQEKKWRESQFGEIVENDEETRKLVKDVLGLENI